MIAEKRRFYTKLFICVGVMFVSPLVVHAVGRLSGSDSPLLSFGSLILVLGSMGMICKLAIDREAEKKNRRERKMKNK
ncbi:hypothetical protein CWI42_040860 [Ordospora colligata]|uniref:Uncharacterized protein n=1 Tax=Ordospora colligata OC4 TaxID=1354746 RepID=A0A0B2UFN4_9MICR|nr:uncharacterized protein M896_040860 [Ordospora colligata OC4]KHN69891.1 hypothetical protein M896_040860 [Ordospora colligata OC4]TBU16061.1 hypothetical protein CWI41_040860 [Ordospora colligata]TBU16274.1 hypothetical protein CWI40_040860 [Ordospora colligata]TBU18978.1 hypothetical protein CWI42_040860 [Ordospora colligata]